MIFFYIILFLKRKEAQKSAAHIQRRLDRVQEEERGQIGGQKAEQSANWRQTKESMVSRALEHQIFEKFPLDSSQRTHSVRERAAKAAITSRDQLG